MLKQKAQRMEALQRELAEEEKQAKALDNEDDDDDSVDDADCYLSSGLNFMNGGCFDDALEEV